MRYRNVFIPVLYVLFFLGKLLVCTAQDVPELKACELLIGSEETLVREVYRVDLLRGKQRVFFHNVPAEADLSSLQIHDKRIRLKLLTYNRSEDSETTPFSQADSGEVIWRVDSAEAVPHSYNTVPGVYCTLQSPVRGERDLEVLYVVTGLTWSADYQLTARGDIRAEEGDMFAVDLSGVVVVSNRTSHVFENAKISVSGSNNRLRPPVRDEPGFLTLSDSPLADLWYADVVEESPENVYRLPGSYTLLVNSGISIPILSARRIPAERSFELESSDFSVLSKGGGIPLEEVIRFSNSGVSGLGNPLPPGRVIVARAGALRYQVAVAEMKHARPGSMIRISLGSNRGILAYRRNRGRTEVQSGSFREYYEINLVSSLDYPVSFVINEEPTTVLKWELVSADAACTRQGGRLILTGELDAKSSRVLAFSIRVQQPLL